MSETRSIVKRYALTVGLTLLGAGSILVAVLLLIVGQTYGIRIAEEIGLGRESAAALNLARWPVIVALLMVATAFLYWAAPNVKLPFRIISPGAVLFVVCWLAASYLFGIYVANFSNYNATYGTLGAIVILMIWFYLTGFLLLLGMEINAYLARQRMPEQLAREGARVPDNARKTTAEPDDWHVEAARASGHIQEAAAARQRAEGVAASRRGRRPVGTPSSRFR